MLDTREKKNLDTGSLADDKKYEYFMEEYDHLERMINNFIRSVERNHKTGEKELQADYRASRIENRESGSRTND
jgi:hypothetical protein